MDIRVGDYGIRTASEGLVVYRVGIVTGENKRGRQPLPESIGREKEELLGFFCKLEQACRWILNEEIRELDTTSFQELADKLDEVLARIVAVCEGLKFRQEAVAENELEDG